LTWTTRDFFSMGKRLCTGAYEVRRGTVTLAVGSGASAQFTASLISLKRTQDWPAREWWADCTLLAARLLGDPARENRRLLWVVNRGRIRGSYVLIRSRDAQYDACRAYRKAFCCTRLHGAWCGWHWDVNASRGDSRQGYSGYRRATRSPWAIHLRVVA